MNANSLEADAAPVPEPAATPPLRPPLLIALAFILFAKFIALPTIVPTPFMHDTGTHLAISYQFDRGAQFGQDVVENVGPYGFLVYPYTYTEYGYGVKMVYRLLFTAVLAALAALAMRLFSHPVHQLVWFMTLLAVPTMSLALYHPEYIFIPLAGCFLVLDGARSLPRRVGLVGEGVVLALLVLLMLTKGTFLFSVILLVMVMTAASLVKRNFLQAGGRLAAFLALLLAAWGAAGQHLTNLPHFVFAMLTFMGGYAEAMALHEPSHMTWLGLMLLVLLPGVLLLRFLQGAPRLPLGLLALLNGFVFFAMWKHAFVRADWVHMRLLFSFAPPVLALAGAGYSEGWAAPSADAVRSGSGRSSPSAAVAGLVMLLFVVMLDPSATVLQTAQSEFAHRGGQIRSLGALGGLQTVLQQRQELLASTQRFPRFDRFDLENEPVDQFGLFGGMPLLMGYRYQPRPVPISFVAVNRKMAEMNAAYLRDPAEAPTFVIHNALTIDSRWVAQDDSLAFLQLLQRYRLIALERNGFLLFGRNALNDGKEMSFRLLREEIVKPGQTVAVPGTEDGPVWMRVDFPQTWAGRQVSFLYKPSPVWIRIRLTDGQESTYRFLPTAGSHGNLIQPYLANPSDVLRLLNPNDPEMHSCRQIESVAWIVQDADAWAFESTATVSFYAIEGTAWKAPVRPAADAQSTPAE